MKRLLTLLILLAVTTQVQAQISSFATFYEEANAFLTENVIEGRVDYTGIKANPAKLNQLTEFIAIAPNPGKSNDQKAFLITKLRPRAR